MTEDGTSSETEDGANSPPALTPPQKHLFALSSAVAHESAKDKPREAGWLASTGKLLVRHLDYGEPLESCAVDLDIPLYRASSRIDQAKLLSKLPIALRFQRGHASGIRYPADLVHTGTAKAAEEIAVGLQRLAKRDPELVERSINTYVHFLQESNRLLLTRRDWCRDEAGTENKLGRFQDVIRFVKLLRVPGLTVQYIGYTLAGVRPDLRSKLQALGLNRRTPVHWVQSQNKRSCATSDQLGIRIGYSVEKSGISQVTSSNAFKYVMAIAAICEVWRRPDRPSRAMHGQASGSRISNGVTHELVHPEESSTDKSNPDNPATNYESEFSWKPEIYKEQSSLFSVELEID